MYQCIVPPTVLGNIRTIALSNRADKVADTLAELQTNPFKKAKETGIPLIGSHYVNAGNQYCVTLDINEKDEVITILHVLRRPYLHRIMKGIMTYH